MQRYHKTLQQGPAAVEGRNGLEFRMNHEERNQAVLMIVRQLAPTDLGGGGVARNSSGDQCRGRVGKAVLFGVAPRNWGSPNRRIDSLRSA